MTSLIKREWMCPREDVHTREYAHARICTREDVRTVVFGKNIFSEKCIEKMKILQSIYIYIYIYIYIIQSILRSIKRFVMLVL